MSRPKILVSSTILPFPPNRGDRARLYRVLACLSEIAEVELIALKRGWDPNSDMEDVVPGLPEVRIHSITVSKLQVISKACQSLFRLQPFMVYRFMNASVLRFFDQHIAAFQPHMFWGYQLDSYPLYRFLGKTKRVLDLIDSLTFHFSNISASSEITSRAKLISLVQPGLQSLERRALLETDRVLVSSPPNLEHMRNLHRLPLENCEVLRASVPESFLESSWKFDQNRPLRVLFVGYLPYPPNQMAVRTAIRDVMPLVWERYPEAQFIVCGSGYESLQNEFGAMRGVTFKGFVADLVREYCDASVMLVSTPYAAGIQTKLVEGMAVGLPAVVSATCVAANGVRHDQEVMAATDAHGMAESIMFMYSDSNTANRISKAARDFVLNNHTTESQRRHIQSIVESVLGSP
jgi:polysaccharide biosynthesis protein PslH